jgi:8-oxo-dGTP pyrophosphatase MutT (NUDIX family)
LEVAIREAQEETGQMSIRPVQSEIFALDVLPVVGHLKGGKYISAHLHLSVCYLLEGSDDEPLVIKADENSDVRWLPMEEIIACSSEPHMHPVYRKIIAKIMEVPPVSNF